MQRPGYSTVERIFRRLSRLEHLASIASWDEAVMMPQGGGDARALAMGELQAMRMETLHSKELAKSMAEAAGEMDDASDWEKANFREAQRIWRNANAVTSDLMEKRALANMRSEQAWRRLRGENNWRGYVPYLKEVVALAREEAKQRSQATGLPLYDTALQMWEPGLTSATVEKVFNELKSFLPQLIERAVRESKGRQHHRINREIKLERQRPMVRHFMEWLDFDFRHGRLDESHHPFCGGVPRDVRLTTRYSTDNFLPGLLGVMHETGHAKYEQNLPENWLEQPVGQARGMAVHESQSLFMEMQVGVSLEFLHYAAPHLRMMLSEPNDPESWWTAENLYHSASQVTRSLIRVEADEVTYPAHILLRYEIERALIEGALEVEDLPTVWDEKMRNYLGLSTLGNDKDGCMQDVHWPAGLFGYFPSYTLGAIIASQLAEAVTKTMPDWRARLQTGEISPTLFWLKENIWSKGSLVTTEDLVRQATGEPLSVRGFRRHLEARYL